MTLNELEIQQQGRVQAIQVSGPIGERLMAMGILTDQEISVERVAPSGEPLWVRVSGSQVALRRLEAEAISVVVEEAPHTSPDRATRERKR